MAQAAIFKEIFDQVRKDLNCELFYSELKRHNVSLYIYYLATDNIHIVLENDNIVLVKGLKKVVNVKFSRNKHLIETSYNKLKSKEITFQQYRENLAKAGVFRWVTNIRNTKDITMPLITHYYLLKASRKLHRSYHAKP
ncbi:putative envelope protein [Escherichia coli]|nr:phage protein [Escherichia coli KOEGE 131 (358a)]STG23490.1 putative envelope protein [Escherichia coli]